MSKILEKQNPEERKEGLRLFNNAMQAVMDAWDAVDDLETFLGVEVEQETIGDYCAAQDSITMAQYEEFVNLLEDPEKSTE